MWLTAMNVFWVGVVSPAETIVPQQEKAFREATTIFVGAILTVIGDKLVDAYLHMCVAKNLWMRLKLSSVQPITTKKYTSVMIRVCHCRSRFLSCMYIHDDFMTESR